MLLPSDPTQPLGARRRRVPPETWPKKWNPRSGFLFLGARTDADDREALRANGITHIINCADNVPRTMMSPATHRSSQYRR